MGPDRLSEVRTRPVLFDLDGTLLDAFDSHYRVYEAVFTGLRMSFNQSTYARHYSPNWYLFYERMGVPRERWDEADQLWLKHYAREIPGERPGASEALRQIRASHHMVGLVTSGDRSRVERDLERMRWTALFDVVVCGGDVPERKPHPAALHHALAQLEQLPYKAAYVGDTIEDVEMGKAAGVITVAILGGFSTREALERAGPDRIIESLDELTDLL
jgi:phosphoglycolate phosphatase